MKNRNRSRGLVENFVMPFGKEKIRMKVELSIKDDAELRALIKDMIRGAVTTIIRDELKEVARQQLSKEMEKTLREVSYYEVRKHLQKSGKIGIEVSTAVAALVGAELEEQIFRKAVVMLQRDNATLDKIVEERIKGLSLRLGA